VFLIAHQVPSQFYQYVKHVHPHVKHVQIQKRIVLLAFPGLIHQLILPFILRVLQDLIALPKLMLMILILNVLIVLHHVILAQA
jgi:hypothetical protein